MMFFILAIEIASTLFLASNFLYTLRKCWLTVNFETFNIVAMRLEGCAALSKFKISTSRGVSECDTFINDMALSAMGSLTASMAILIGDGLMAAPFSK